MLIKLADPKLYDVAPPYLKEIIEKLDLKSGAPKEVIDSVAEILIKLLQGLVVKV